MATKRDVVCYAAWVGAVTTAATVINRAVPEPYMDEIFHVPQAQTYCAGDWSYWDPALTTPPGLYLLPAALAHLKRVSPWLPSTLSSVDPCSVTALRTTNLVLSLSLPLLCASILRLLSTPEPRRISGGASPTPLPPASASRDTSRSPLQEGLVIALFPLLGWWSWLYYTDMGAVLTVLLCWKMGLERRYALSAVLGAASLLFRQTNIVWLAFVAGQAAVTEVERASLLGQAGGVRDPRLADVQPGDLLRTPISLALAALSHLPSFLPLVASYIPVFAAAAAFVKWNGGIVLGDKANHVPTIHVAQCYYCVAFAGVFFLPHLLGIRQVKVAAWSLCGSARRLLVTLSVLAGMCWSIKHYTIAHPFLLADNRHYAFYLWRRVINVHPLARYALAPGYLATATLIWHALARARTMHLSTFLLFVGATIAVLLPTPLLEPRYFLLPLLLLRLYLAPGAPLADEASNTSPPPHKRNHAALRRRRARTPSPSSSRSVRMRRLTVEAVLYLSVQALCVYLFLTRPFYWDVAVGADGRGLDGRDEREVGRLQRFMW